MYFNVFWTNNGAKKVVYIIGVTFGNLEAQNSVLGYFSMFIYESEFNKDNNQRPDLYSS
jgi:hypothetical protein